MPDNKKTKEERIDSALFLLADLYNKDLSTALVTLYHQILEPYLIDEIERALKVLCETQGFFPKPNEIIDIINIHRDPPGPSVKARAQQQWRVILQQVGKHGSYHPPKFSDPITQHLVSTQFRWPYLCEMNESNEDWEQRRWCDAFELAVELYADLKQIGVPEKVRDLLDDIGSE